MNASVIKEVHGSKLNPYTVCCFGNGVLLLAGKNNTKRITIMNVLAYSPSNDV